MLNRTFWVRFAVLLVIAIVPLLLLTLSNMPGPSNPEEIARRGAQELDRLIQLRQQQVFTIAAFPSIRAFAASPPETRSQRAAVALNELQSWVASDTSVREAFITNLQGIVTMTTREGWDADLSGRKFVQDSLSGQLAVSPVARDRGEFSTYYGAPVLDNTGEIAGALVIRVAAQEMWSVTPLGENWYAVVSDENGVRLDDSGDFARRLSSFAPLQAERAAQIVAEQTYGAELPLVRSTNLTRAQELISTGKLEQLQAVDFSAQRIAAQRLVSKPWVVLALVPGPSYRQLFPQLAVPFLAALLLAFGGALVLARL